MIEETIKSPMEQLENAYVHLQLLLWGDDKKNEDQQFIEWRNDLEVSIADIVRLEKIITQNK